MGRKKNTPKRKRLDSKRAISGEGKDQLNRTYILVSIIFAFFFYHLFLKTNDVPEEDRVVLQLDYLVHQAYGTFITIV